MNSWTQRLVHPSRMAEGGFFNGRRGRRYRWPRLPWAINGGRGLSRCGIKRFTTGPQISTDAMDECEGGLRHPPRSTRDPRYGLGYRTVHPLPLFVPRVPITLNGHRGPYRRVRPNSLWWCSLPIRIAADPLARRASV